MDIQKHLLVAGVLTLAMPAYVTPVEAQKIVVGSCTLKDGGIYTGELSGSKPNGKGRVQYENGDTYEGEFSKGLRHGEGTFTAADGSRYEGNWTKNERNGRGTFYAVNNNRYVGLWYRNQKEGTGKMFRPRHLYLQERSLLQRRLAQRPEERQRIFRLERRFKIRRILGQQPAQWSWHILLC